MKKLYVAIGIELLKIRKSKVFWLILVFFAFVPLMTGLIMFVQKHPEIASKLGLIGTKANLLRFGEPNWKNYFTLLNQFGAAIGYIGFGFITTWIFGREFSDHTGKDIIALPVSRRVIVNAKFLAAFVWSILISLEFYLIQILIGHVIQLTGWSGTLLLHNMTLFALSFLLTFLLCTPVAFFASYGRGFLLSFGVIVLTLIMANFAGLVGLGKYFPWSIPGSYATMKGIPGMQPDLVSYLILFITALIGYLGTLRWWMVADQK